MSKLLLARHTPDQVVAFGADEERTVSHLLADSATVAAALPAADEGSWVLLVFQEDFYGFAAAFLGALSAGHRVVLPPDLSGNSISLLLERPGLAGLVHDTRVGAHLHIDRLLGASTRPWVAPSGREEMSWGAIGSGWAPKTLQEIVAGLAPIASELGPVRVASTLSPSHPLAAHIGVLLPLVSGGAFAMRRAQLAHATELLMAPASLRELLATGKALPERLLCSGPLDPPTRALVGSSTSLLELSLGAEGLAFGAELERSEATRVEERLREDPAVGDVAVYVAPAGTYVGYVADEEVPVSWSSEWVAAQLSQIPRDRNGELDSRALLARFGRDERGDLRPTALELGSTEVAGQVVQTHVKVPARYAHFDGHFDGYPVMAGVVQLHELVLPALERHRPDLGPVRAFQRLKFLGRIRPGDELLLSLEFGELSCDFRLVRAGKVCSAGRLILGGEDG